MMSLFSNAGGMDSTWIGVGALKPSEAHDLHSSGMIPREANVRVGSMVVPLTSSSPWLMEGDGERDGPASAGPEAELASDPAGDAERE